MVIPWWKSLRSRLIDIPQYGYQNTIKKNLLQERWSLLHLQHLQTSSWFSCYMANIRYPVEKSWKIISYERRKIGWHCKVPTPVLMTNLGYPAPKETLGIWPPWFLMYFRHSLTKVIPLHHISVLVHPEGSQNPKCSLENPQVPSSTHLQRRPRQRPAIISDQP